MQFLKYVKEANNTKVDMLFPFEEHRENLHTVINFCIKQDIYTKILFAITYARNKNMHLNILQQI